MTSRGPSWHLEVACLRSENSSVSNSSCINDICIEHPRKLQVSESFNISSAEPLKQQFQLYPFINIEAFRRHFSSVSQSIPMKAPFCKADSYTLQQQKIWLELLLLRSTRMTNFRLVSVGVVRSNHCGELAIQKQEAHQW